MFSDMPDLGYGDHSQKREPPTIAIITFAYDNS